MILNLKQVFQITGENILIDYQINKEELTEYKSLVFVTPITVKGSVFNRAGIVTLDISVSSTLHHFCDRCLREFDRDYSFSVSHILVRSLNEENDEFILTENDRLDLDELVLSDLQLQLPSKMLCKEDCKGLCSICGTDLNESQCSCRG